MRRADVSVHVEQRRLPCVLEPSLLLTHAQGPSLAMRLVSVVEPWLTRSFWQALDNSELLTGRVPQLGSATPISGAALTRWIQLRERTDESAWVLRWVGDRIAESQLRDVEDLSLFDQFELLQAALELRAEQRGMTLRSPWPGLDLRRAALDALSLSAVLEGRWCCVRRWRGNGRHWWCWRSSSGLTSLRRSRELRWLQPGVRVRVRERMRVRPAWRQALRPYLPPRPPRCSQPSGPCSAKRWRAPAWPRWRNSSRRWRCCTSCGWTMPVSRPTRRPMPRLTSRSPWTLRATARPRIPGTARASGGTGCRANGEARCGATCPRLT